MKNILIIILLFNLATTQWEQSEGTEGLDMQAITSYEQFIFAGGATGTYKSNNEAEN